MNISSDFAMSSMSVYCVPADLGHGKGHCGAVTHALMHGGTLTPQTDPIYPSPQNQGLIAVKSSKAIQVHIYLYVCKPPKYCATSA